MPITEFPAGGLGAGFAPEEWAAYVLDNLSAASVILASGATEVRTTAKAVHVPKFTGDAATNWYDELEPIGEGAPPGVDLVLTPQKVAALATLSNETVADSNANVLDSVGQKMVRSVALAADKAMFNGTGGKQPTGILNITPALPSHTGTVDYAGLVTAAGIVRAAGGVPNAAYVNPADLTALQLATDATDRPLVGTTEGGLGATIAGMVLWPTPAVPAAKAVVAQADQIVVAVREDASVAVSRPIRLQRGRHRGSRRRARGRERQRPGRVVRDQGGGGARVEEVVGLEPRVVGHGRPALARSER